jgi:RNA polymerase sigma factor (sigma-70 family)
METTCKMPGDTIIWNAFREGNREAYAALYYRYSGILLQSCQWISSDKEMVKDCIHDLFVEIWKNKINLGSPRSVHVYLVCSIRRKIIRQLKKARASQKKAQWIGEMTIAHSIEDQIISDQYRQEQKVAISKAVNALTRRQQEAVHLKFYANMSYPEIAGMMSITTDAVYNLVSKAIGNIQQGLTKSPVHKLNKSFNQAV